MGKSMVAYIHERRRIKMATSSDSLSKERMGEIALMCMKMLITKKKLLDTMDPQEIRRHVGSMAKDIGIDYEEASQFAGTLLAGAFRNVLEGLNKEKRGPGPGF